MEDYRVRYQQWLEDPFIDEATKAELRGITDENEIKEPLGRLRRDWQIISKRKAHRSRA